MKPNSTTALDVFGAEAAEGDSPLPTPSVGRIVHFIPSDNSDAVLPAIITRVWSDRIVNLHIFLDEANIAHKTSVEWGGEAGNWFWPPKV